MVISPGPNTVCIEFVEVLNTAFQRAHLSGCKMTPYTFLSTITLTLSKPISLACVLIVIL